MEYRSPLESIFSVIGGLPQGHDKPVKHALYNAVAHLLLILSCGGVWALYIILQPFVKPLMWAVLVGSALHPLKRSLRDRFQNWFEKLEATSTPVVFGIVVLPLNIINDFSEFIGDILWKRFNLIITVGISIPVLLILYNYTPNFVIVLLWNSILFFYNFLNFCLDNCSLTLVGTVILAYLSLVFFMWKPENNTTFHYASSIIWILVSFCFARQFGSFQMPLFVFLQIVFFGGFVSEVYEIYNNMKTVGHPISIMESLSLAFHDKVAETDVPDENLVTPESSTEDVKDEPLKKEEDTPKSSVSFTEAKGDGVSQPKKEKDPFSLELFEDKSLKHLKRKESELNSTGVLITNQGIHLVKQQTETLRPELKKVNSKLLRSLSQPQFFPDGRQKKANILRLSRKLSLKSSQSSIVDTETFGSTFYLYSVLWACIVMLFWKNFMLLPLLSVPILLYTVKHIGLYLGLWRYLYENMYHVLEVVAVWCSKRHDALVPVPIRGLYRFVHKINTALKTSVKTSIDTVSTTLVILGLILFLICGSLFIMLQIYAEAIMMVQMTSNVINQTVVHNPELRQLLPPTWDDTVDSILDNAYQYGREGISKAVKSIMVDADQSKSERLEKQVLELWDRIYQSWMSTSDSMGPKVTEEAVKSTWDAFIEDVKKSPEMLNVNGLVDFAKQNVGTLMSLLESVWGILKGNVTLIVGSFSTMIYVLLLSGTAVLNFILNVVVFLTTLFYLLNSSGELYKPVELLTNFSPSGSRFGHALEGAVNGVFSASFKMAAFYGLWTWFIHNLFGVKIVYLPSAFATILAAVPFLGTYWACVPAVLDLWLAQDRYIAAILIAVFQFLPTSIVDTTIYTEIKGGHPYLTGLAIAGGIFCLGVEGAIIGPLLLCGLYVAIDLSSSFFKESPSEESLNYRIQQINN